MCANTCDNITRMPSIETTMGSTTNSLAFFAEEEKRENCSKAFMVHEDDCTKYYVCRHGIPMLRICNPGTMFNPSNFVCDWPLNVFKVQPQCQENYLTTLPMIQEMEEDKKQKEPPITQIETSNIDDIIIIKSTNTPPAHCESDRYSSQISLECLDYTISNSLFYRFKFLWSTHELTRRKILSIIRSRWYFP